MFFPFPFPFFFSFPFSFTFSFPIFFSFFHFLFLFFLFLFLSSSSFFFFLIFPFFFSFLVLEFFLFLPFFFLYTCAHTETNLNPTAIKGSFLNDFFGSGLEFSAGSKNGSRQDLHFMAFKESEVRGTAFAEAEFHKSMWMYLGICIWLSLKPSSVRKQADSLSCSLNPASPILIQKFLPRPWQWDVTAEGDGIRVFVGIVFQSWGVSTANSPCSLKHWEPWQWNISDNKNEPKIEPNKT